MSDHDSLRHVRHPFPTHCLARTAIAAAIASAAALPAQWPATFQTYSIARLGLLGPTYTTGSGDHWSSVQVNSGHNRVAGITKRITIADGGYDGWLWDGSSTIQVGFTGGVYTGSGGHQHSRVVAYNSSGRAAGFSKRLTGVDTDNGRDAWLWNGTALVQLGYTGTSYTGLLGYQYSEPLSMNDAGTIIGRSYLVTGIDSYYGEQLWAHATTTTQLGLLSGYSGQYGYQVHRFGQQNGAGQVTGTSQRITGQTTSLGDDTWVWNGTTTVRINPSAGEYTSSGGYRHSGPTRQNEAGTVTGFARRYTGTSTVNGTDVFVWNGTTTTIVGLLDTAHTGSAGYRSSQVEGTGPALSSAGRVIGTTIRLLGVNTQNGWDAWVYDGTTTRQIGLTGPGYTGSNGLQQGNPRFLDAAGRVAGIASRISGVNTDDGSQAWVDDGTTTVAIGLTGGVYTSSTGRQESAPTGMNNRGHVVGVAYRYSGSTAIGQHGFFWNGSTSVPIGLTGGAYTAASGLQFASPLAIDEHDHAIGTQKRYTSAGVQNGEGGFYFDAATGTVHDIGAGVADLVRTADGYSFLRPVWLTTEGIALGHYWTYAGGTGPQVEHGFAYRPDLGFTDLGALIPGGLANAGWNRLTYVGWSSIEGPRRMTQLLGMGRVSTSPTELSVFAMSVPLANAAQNTSYGQACGGIALAVQPAPVSGYALRYTTSNLPVLSPLAIQVVSLAKVDPGTELSHLGAPNCYQLVDANLGASVYLGGRPTATYTLQLPWSSSFVGLPLCCQSVALVPGANALGMVFSNGVRSVVHWY